MCNEAPAQCRAYTKAAKFPKGKSKLLNSQMSHELFPGFVLHSLTFELLMSWLVFALILITTINVWLMPIYFHAKFNTEYQKYFKMLSAQFLFTILCIVCASNVDFRSQWTFGFLCFLFLCSLFIIGYFLCYLSQ